MNNTLASQKKGEDKQKRLLSLFFDLMCAIVGAALTIDDTMKSVDLSMKAYDQYMAFLISVDGSSGTSALGRCPLAIGEYGYIFANCTPPGAVPEKIYNYLYASVDHNRANRQNALRKQLATTFKMDLAAVTDRILMGYVIVNHFKEMKHYVLNVLNPLWQLPRSGEQTAGKFIQV